MRCAFLLAQEHQVRKGSVHPLIVQEWLPLKRWQPASWQPVVQREKLCDRMEMSLHDQSRQRPQARELEKVEHLDHPRQQ